MNRKFRIRKSREFGRVRQFGKSFAHPLATLVASRNGLQFTRYGIVVSRAVGNAVQRNRIKRLMKEVLRKYQSAASPGWDLVFILRSQSKGSTYQHIHGMVGSLLADAKLLMTK